VTRWLELRVTASNETVEAVADLLSRCTGRGVAIEQAVPTPVEETEASAHPSASMAVVGYLPDSQESPQALRQAEEGLWHLAQIGAVGTLAVRPIEEEDWATAWREHFHVTRVGRRCAIVPTWREHTPAPGDIVIALDPGMAFGTGLHPSTRLCLQALEEHVLPGMQVLDLGTGSGILALAAAKLGAGHVLALDTDPVAVRAAQENVARNGLQSAIAVQRGSLELAPPDEFHLAVANLTAKLIGELAGGILSALRPGGLLIASGFLEERQAEMASSLERAGGNVRDCLAEGDWAALVVRQRGDH
jgi:ribosomal protein L11 methyltransferase